jgi:hypothetical protein
MIDPQLSDEPGAPTRSTLRQFAGLWLLFFAGLAVWRGYARHEVVPAIVLALVALAFGPVGLLRPSAVRPLFQLSLAVSRPVGWLTSELLLACLFYGVFTPMALLFRLIGRDALRKKRRSGAGTYWQSKPAASDPASYLRQA